MSIRLFKRHNNLIIASRHRESTPNPTYSRAGTILAINYGRVKQKSPPLNLRLRFRLSARGVEETPNQSSGLKRIYEIGVFPILARQREANAVTALRWIDRNVVCVCVNECRNVVKFVSSVTQNKVHQFVRRANPNVRAVDGFERFKQPMDSVTTPREGLGQSEHLSRQRTSRRAHHEFSIGWRGR